MTPGTEVRLLLEPVVSRPRIMTLGRPHLVAVDLRLAGPVEDWPYDEEEFAFTCMLDASSGLSTVAVHDATVLVHRFAGSYGPAEFLVTPGEATGDHSLWLTILTPRGVVIHTSELPVRVGTEPPDGAGTATRSILAPVPVLHRRHADNAERRRITKALRESEPSSYPVLTLVGSERHDDFLRLVGTRIDPAAELLYASPQQCAVLITEPEPSVESLQRATSGWGPDVRVEFQRYTFRPTALDSLRVRGTDGQIFELRGVPTTTPVRAVPQALLDEYPAPDESHDFALERTGPGGTPHRLDPDQMLHDAGILDGDELSLVLVAKPNLFEDAVDRLVRSLRRPNTHLIVDGGDVAGLGYGDLPLNDQHARVLSGLRRLVRATGAEITCVFEGVEWNASVVIQAPRGVRVLFSPPGESARPLLQRLVQAEPAERAVVVVSSDPSVARSASEGRVEFASSPLLLHWFTQAAGDIVQLFWLLDCSGSMALDGKIGALNYGMERTIADLREFAAEHSDLHLTARAITFSNGAQWHPQNPAPVDEFDWSPVTTGGPTDLGAALRLLSRELRGLSTLGREPSVIIILVTDGLATDEWRPGLRELRNTPAGRNALRGAIIIGDQTDQPMVREFLDDPETEPRQADTPEQISSAIRDVSLEAARAAWTRLSSHGQYL